MVKGMLSTKAETTTENHTIALYARKGCPLATFDMVFAASVTRPVEVRLPTTMKRPHKRRTVDQSRLRRRSMHLYRTSAFQTSAKMAYAIGIAPKAQSGRFGMKLEAAMVAIIVTMRIVNQEVT